MITARALGVFNKQFALRNAASDADLMVGHPSSSSSSGSSDNNRQ